MASAYEILGVARTASDGEIRRAYRLRAKDAHPDRSGDHELFLAIKAAYEILANPERRALYDADPDGSLMEVQVQIERRRMRTRRRRMRLMRLYD